MVWVTPRHATLTIGSQTWDVLAGQYTQTDADALMGTWEVAAEGITDSSAAAVPTSGSAIMKVSASPLTASSFSTIAGADPIPADAKIYEMTCVTGQQGSGQVQDCTGLTPFIEYLSPFEVGDVRAFLWYDTATGKAQLFGAETQLGQLTVWKDRYGDIPESSLFATGNRIQEIYLGAALPGHFITFSRLPTGTMRYTGDTNCAAANPDCK